jgi:hypothetical protein
MNSIARLCEQYLLVTKQIHSNFLEGNSTKIEYAHLSAGRLQLEQQIKEGIATNLTSGHHAHVLVYLIWHGMPTYDPQKEEKLLLCLIDVLNAQG